MRYILIFLFVYSTKDNFTFKCHRSVVTGAGQTQDIFAVCVCVQTNIHIIYLYVTG